MCELFAKSSSHPATVNVSLETFAQHGGGSAPNDDGWGIAFQEGNDFRLIKDTRRATGSPWVRFIESEEIESKTVIAHVRNASRGEVVFSNNHPFQRELGGRSCVFAHNGTLDGITEDDRFSTTHFRPVGSTDSEQAFCVLLERLERRSLEDDIDTWLDEIAAFAQELRVLGPANFLLSTGGRLFVHSHKRRRADGVIESPGLHMMRLEPEADDIEGGGIAIERSEPKCHSLLFASVPLGDGPWEEVEEGTVLAVADGHVLARRNSNR